MNYGTVEISKTSGYVNQINGQKVSPFLHEKFVYIGQEMCYEEASKTVEILLNLETNDTCIFRLTDKMGSSLADEIYECEYQKKEEIKENEIVYSQVDGSMLLTREDGWKEVKLGRVFKSGSILAETSKRNWLKESEYIAHWEIT